MYRYFYIAVVKPYHRESSDNISFVFTYLPVLFIHYLSEATFAHNIFAMVVFAHKGRMKSSIWSDALVMCDKPYCIEQCPKIYHSVEVQILKWDCYP